MVRVILWFLIASIFPVEAFAQANVTTFPAPWGQVGDTVTLSASGTSATVALPWTAVSPKPQPPPQTIVVCNTASGAVDTYALPVPTSTSAVTTGTGVLVPAGACQYLAQGPPTNLYLAAITAGSSTTLSIMTGTGTLSAGGAGSGGGLGFFMTKDAANSTSAALSGLGNIPQVSATKLGFSPNNTAAANLAVLQTIMARTDSPTVAFDVPGVYPIACPATTISAQSNISLLGTGQGLVKFQFTRGCTLPANNLLSWQAGSFFNETGGWFRVSGITFDMNYPAVPAALTVILGQSGHVGWSFDHVDVINAPQKNIVLIGFGDNGTGTSGGNISDSYLQTAATVTTGTSHSNTTLDTLGSTLGVTTGTVVTSPLISTVGTTNSTTGLAITGSTAGITSGMYVTGNGIPTGTTGTISGSTVTLSNAATTSLAGLPINFTSIAPGTTVSTVNSTTSVTLSNAIGASIAGLSITFQGNVNYNQCILASNAGGGGISNITIARNRCVGSDIFVDAHDSWLEANDVSYYAFGTGLGAAVDAANSYSMHYLHNVLHDSPPTLDSNSTFTTGIEAWAPKSEYVGDICRNTGGACIDNGGQNSTLTGNSAFGTDKRYLVAGGVGNAFTSRYASSTVNGNGSTYSNNMAVDDGSGLLGYGYGEQSSSVAGNTLPGNHFTGASTGSLNILGASTAYDAISSGLVSAVLLGVNAAGQQVAAGVSATLTYLGLNTTNNVIFNDLTLGTALQFTGDASFLHTQQSGSGAGFDAHFPNGGVYRTIQTNLFGTNDTLAQLQTPSTAGFAVVETFGSAGLSIGTGGNTNPVIFKVNRAEVGRFASTGLNISGALTAPGLASSSAATTGALCWTTGTGNVTVNTVGPCNGVGGVLSGTTGSIGGGALLPGACVAGTATVTGATSSMAVAASPSADPDSTLSAGISFYAFVSSSNTVTVRVCAIVAVTPTATPYNVRVLQ